MSGLYPFVTFVVIFGVLLATLIFFINKKAKAEVAANNLKTSNDKYKNAEKIAAKPAGSVDDIIDGL